MRVSFFAFAALFACVLVAQADKAKFGAILGGFASVLAPGANTASLLNCMDDATAARIVAGIADLIKQASSCQLTKAVSLGNKAKALTASIPASQKECFKADPAGKQIAAGLGINPAAGDKAMNQLVQKAISYAMRRFSEVCSSLKVLNGDISSGNLAKFGADGARTLKKVLA